MRGSEDDSAAFRYMDAYDAVCAIPNDKDFTRAYLSLTLRMAGEVSLDAQLAVVESDSWKKCEDRLNVLAEKERTATKKKTEKPSIFERLWAWIKL